MSKYLSHKLTILNTLLIIMVVYVHSSYLEAEQYPTAWFLQELTWGGCRVATRLFFCISGYLFARNICGFKDIWTKQKKRMRTLLLPYLLWNVIFVLWYVVLEIVPGISQFNNSSGIIAGYLSQPLWDSLYNLFIAPAAFQLWFLRDLLVMVAFVPVLWWIANRSWVVALILAICSVALYSCLLYFWIGIILAVKRVDIEAYPRSALMVIASMAVYIGAAVYVALGNKIHEPVEAFVNLVGIYLVWSLYDCFARGKCLADKHLWKHICGYSFFIFCFHEPTFNIIKKLALVVCGTSEPTLIFLYYINPWIMMFVAITVAKLLQRIVPQAYKILTGSRV